MCRRWPLSSHRLRPPRPPRRKTTPNRTTGPPMSEQPEEKLAEGTLISHLLELRSRLIRAAIAVLIAFIPCAFYANRIFSYISQPLRQKLPPGAHLIATGVMTPFTVPFKLSFFVALFAAMPYVLYQVWAFVAPGLYRHEK